MVNTRDRITVVEPSVVPTTVEPRVTLPVVEPRVDFKKSPTPSISTTNTKSGFNGRRVPMQGTRFSQRLQDLNKKHSSKRHIPNWEVPYY